MANGIIPDIARDKYEAETTVSSAEAGKAMDIDMAAEEGRQYILDYQRKFSVNLLTEGAGSRDKVREVLRSFCQERNMKVEGINEFSEVVAAIEAAIFDFGPLTDYIFDERVEEIQVNTPKDIRVIVGGIEYETDRLFSSTKQLETIAGKMAMLDGKRLAPDTPFVDVRLKDGVRAALVHESVSIAGCNITIRKQRKNPITTQNLITWGSLSTEMDDFLKATRDAGVSHVFSGGTGTGKTATMAAYIRESRVRKISIADTDEMALLETDAAGRTLNQALMWQVGQYASFKDGVKATLRHTPHMVILQEMRDGVCEDVLTMAGTDHQVFVSVHSMPGNLMDRIIDLYMQSGTALSEDAILRKFATSFGIVAQMDKFEDGSKKLHSICEIRWQNERLTETPIYSYQLTGFTKVRVHDAYLNKEVERAVPVGEYKKINGISETLAQRMLRKQIDPQRIKKFQEGGTV